METRVTFEEYLDQLKSFHKALRGLVSVSADMDVKELRNLLNEFYVYGWDFEFGDGKSFYAKEGNYLKALDAVKEEGREDELKEILEKIWQILPEFYAIHEKLGDETPSSPEKWF